jgi:hypothetical protein
MARPHIVTRGNCQCQGRTPLSSPRPTGSAFQFGDAWQYHPRSDRHSKVACWALMFDLIEACSLLRSHLEAGKVAIGINHTMRDFARDREKNLDLVVCRGPRWGHGARTGPCRMDRGQSSGPPGLPLSNIDPTEAERSSKCQACRKAPSTESKAARTRFAVFSEPPRRARRRASLSDACAALSALVRARGSARGFKQRFFCSRPKGRTAAGRGVYDR